MLKKLSFKINSDKIQLALLNFILACIVKTIILFAIFIIMLISTNFNVLTQNLSRHFGKVNVSTQFDSRHIKPIMLVLIELPHVAYGRGIAVNP